MAARDTLAEDFLPVTSLSFTLLAQPSTGTGTPTDFSRHVGRCADNVRARLCAAAAGSSNAGNVGERSCATFRMF